MWTLIWSIRMTSLKTVQHSSATDFYSRPIYKGRVLLHLPPGIRLKRCDAQLWELRNLQHAWTESESRTFPLLWTQNFSPSVWNSLSSRISWMWHARVISTMWSRPKTWHHPQLLLHLHCHWGQLLFQDASTNQTQLVTSAMPIPVSQLIKPPAIVCSDTMWH